MTSEEELDELMISSYADVHDDFDEPMIYTRMNVLAMSIT